MPRANLSVGTGFQVAYPDQAPEPIPVHFASGYAADIYVGTPLTRLSDGSFQRAAAGGGAGISAVVVAILQFRDSSGKLVRNGKYIPSGTTWTAHAERSMALAVPVYPDARFKVQADDGATITTLAAYRTAVGNNADHVYETADQGLGLSGVALDISTVNTTATLQWRIVDLLEGPGNDATVTRATYIVTANVITGFGGLPAVLGV